MLDPMPRQDVKLPPTPREAELMGEIERLRQQLRHVMTCTDDDWARQQCAVYLKEAKSDT